MNIISIELLLIGHIEGTTVNVQRTFMAPSKVDLVVASSFADLAILRAAGQAPRSCARAAVPSTGYGSRHGTDHPPTMVDGVLHTCGPLCQHRRRNNDGSYTCLLTGISYGQTMSHGSFDTNNFIDDFGDVRAAGGKRAQTAPRAPWHNLEAVAITVIHHLFVAVGPHGELVPGPRVALERKKRARALASGLRLAQNSFTKCKAAHLPAPTGLALMCTVLAELDRACAVNRVEPLTPPMLDALVRLCVSFVSRIVVPFHQGNSQHKPTPSYLIGGVLFLFAQRNMDRLHIPFLRKNLPDHRHVMLLDPPFMVKRLTWARRYAQAAFLHSTGAAPPHTPT